MGTTSLTLASFNGTSQYAGSLQNMITHAVTIASIPLNQLQINVADLQGQTAELTALQTKFSAIQTAIQSLDSSSGGQSLVASSSDNTVATATLNPALAVSGGTYTVNILDPGSSTSTLSTVGATVTDPTSTSISTSTAFTLTVNGSTFTVNPASNSLNSLAQAINTANAGVTATVLNLGSPSAPDYRLALQSTSLGNVPIQLNDGTQDLLTTLSTGTLAQYQIDGQPSTPISSNSSTVTIAPGVNVSLLKAGQSTITVSPSSHAAENAISAFVTAYNAAQTELANNHGSTGGALTGQSIINELSQTIRDVINYSGGTGSVTGLTSLGVTFNQSGQLQFDQTQFESVVASSPNDVSAFLGSAVSGTGFLGAATAALNGLEDSSNGLFATTNKTFQDQIANDNNEIQTTTDRITTLQNQLVAQMSAADSLIASLQNQVSYFTTLFQDTQNAIKNS